MKTTTIERVRALRGLLACAVVAGAFASGAGASAQDPSPAPSPPSPSGSRPAPSAPADAPSDTDDEPTLRGDSARALEAMNLVQELSLAEAAKKLEGADPNDQLLTYARGFLALYEGRCAEAAALFDQPSFNEHEPVRRLLEIARGCEKATAGAVIREDEDSGTWVRFQHDADVVLAPLLYDVVKASRVVFERDLGVTMPRPLRLEIVRDQHGLSSMTGLPLEAARTTGTIGIAKYGRVIVVSPRAADNGYPVLDTIAHELTHLALTRASRDEAPLWFQEGVARTMEVKWRDPTPFDHVPSPDDLAAYGIKKNIGPEIDRIGPSIALLPSAEQAQITYAKVQSFTEFFAREGDANALPKLLVAMRDAGQASEEVPVSKIVESVSGSSFESWSTRWKAEVLATAKELPERERPGAAPPKELKEVRQRYRLGELLLERGHAKAAAKELDRGLTLMPREASVRALLARAVFDDKDVDRAKQLVERPEDVHHNEARWWSMRAAVGVPDTSSAIRMAIALAPYDPSVACEEKSPPLLPEDPTRRALCEAARSKPHGR